MGITPDVAENCSAVELDDLLMLHGRFSQIMKDRNGNG
jgi:hypothetical protein